MLKIKDNVDLKELEKFDFYKDRNLGDGLYYYRFNNIYVGQDRILYQDDGLNDYHAHEEWDITEYDLDALFNIIQAGLVEKVSED